MQNTAVMNQLLFIIVLRFSPTLSASLYAQNVFHYFVQKQVSEK